MQSIQEKTSTYILSNLLSVLSVTSLLVDSIIFLLYFFDIQYFPNLNFNDSVLFLFVAAITGIYTLLSLAILLTVAYLPRWVVMRNTQQKTFDPIESQIFTLVITESNGISNKYKTEITSNKKENDPYKEISWYFASLFFISLDVLAYRYLQSISTLVPILVFLAIIIWQFHFYCQRKPKKTSLFGAWIISFFITLVILIFMLNMVEKLEEMTFVLVSIMLGNILLSGYQEVERTTIKTLYLMIIPIIVALLVLPRIDIGGRPFPKFVMNKYKFGNFKPQQLLINAEGCNILKNLELIPDNSKNKTTCSLNNIKILSRLGRSFYLESTFLCKSPWLCNPLNFTISSNHILSWSVTTPPKNITNNKVINFNFPHKK